MRIQQSLTEESQTLSVCEESGIAPVHQRYKRIAVARRNELLQKIFFENKRIKTAAKEMNINYSSAKTILHLYRKKSKKSGTHLVARIPDHLRCRYALISPVGTPRQSVVSRCSSSSTSLNSSTFNLLQDQSPPRQLEVVITQGGKYLSRVTMASTQLEIVQAVSRTSTDMESECEQSAAWENSFEKQAISASSELDLCQFRCLFEIHSDSSTQIDTGCCSTMNP